MADTICIKGGNVFFSDGGTIQKKDILISDVYLNGTCHGTRDSQFSGTSIPKEF